MKEYWVRVKLKAILFTKAKTSLVIRFNCHLGCIKTVFLESRACFFVSLQRLIIIYLFSLFCSFFTASLSALWEKSSKIRKKNQYLYIYRFLLPKMGQHFTIHIANHLDPVYKCTVIKRCDPGRQTWEFHISGKYELISYLILTP